MNVICSFTSDSDYYYLNFHAAEGHHPFLLIVITALLAPFVAISEARSKKSESALNPCTEIGEKLNQRYPNSQ